MAGLGGTLLVIGDLNLFQPNVTGGRGRVLTFDESALIDEALALGDKLSEALAPRRYRPLRYAPAHVT